jgi:hypothetical protein
MLEWNNYFISVTKDEIIESGGIYYTKVRIQMYLESWSG